MLLKTHLFLHRPSNKITNQFRHYFSQGMPRHYKNIPDIKKPGRVEGIEVTLQQQNTTQIKHILSFSPTTPKTLLHKKELGIVISWNSSAVHTELNGLSNVKEPNKITLRKRMWVFKCAIVCPAQGEW